MNQIKFSNVYSKFERKKLPFKAKLLHCFLIDESSIQPAFRDYDTKYFNLENEGDDIGFGFYALPPGKLIVLLLKAEEGEVFTTIRRYTPDKLDWYNSLVGQLFEIVYTGDERA